MSVDPLWFSTMFGVYYWAGGFVTFGAVLTLATLRLQHAGRMRSDRQPGALFHDSARLMFAFTFFWGYIAFSQFMLYWYAVHVPENQLVPASLAERWQLGVVIIFATFVLPLASVSRYAKRNFWAVWMTSSPSG